MSLTVVYRDTGSVIGHHDDRRDAVRDAVVIAFQRPDLSFIVGVVEVGDDGTARAPFSSASDLLAANDADAIAAANDADAIAASDPDANDWEFVDEENDVSDTATKATTPGRPYGSERGVTKDEFVGRVASSSGLSQEDAVAAVDAVMSSIEDALKSGEEVNFTGFGKFHVAERGAGEGRNPRTGETMTIAASKVPRFTADRPTKRS